MYRDLYNNLLNWKDHPERKPLLLRGARQVGKSWLVKEFSKQFKNFVIINFEKDKKIAPLFESDLHIPTLLENLSLYTQQKIIPGETLLFLDEIQECERAIVSLRYFKEDLPKLHVIAAGSLLDFVPNKIGMPVGRIQFMYLYPLSFGEFLTALGQEELRRYIIESKINPVIHEKILELLKNYLWLGGMPEVLDAWLKYKDVKLCQQMQNDIILTYIHDFYKYARQKQIQYVAKVFDAIPTQLGNKFKFSHVDSEIRALFLKEALMLLENAGIAHICYHTSSHELPLGASVDNKKFKVFFFDVGLAQKILGLMVNQWLVQPLPIKTLGSIAEQFVAQEFIAYSNVDAANKLYYWHREAKSSNAEVDFVFTKNNNIIPVEVKAGKKGNMKSLHRFLATHPTSPYGVKIAEGTFGWQEKAKIEEIPLYGIEAWLKEEDRGQRTEDKRQKTERTDG